MVVGIKTKASLMLSKHPITPLPVCFPDFLFLCLSRGHTTSVAQDGADLPLLKDSASCWDYRHGPFILTWILDLN